MSDELKNRIESDAARPQSISVDGQSVTQRSLSDQIAADKYLRNQRAVDNSPGFGLRFGKMIPPGAV